MASAIEVAQVGARAILVDLRAISFHSEADLERHLVNQLRVSGAPRHAQEGSGVESALRRELLSLLSQASGGLCLLLDSLDCVPEQFVRRLSVTFRALFEERFETEALRQLSLVFAGALSIHDLRHDADSAFAVAKLVVLPEEERRVWGYWVEEGLAAHGLLAEPEVVEVLAEETRGEPGFLNPILERWEREEGEVVDAASLGERLNNHEWVFQSCVLLEEVITSIGASRRLEKIIDDLLLGRVVRAAALHADVDPLHLMGPVVLAKSKFGRVYVLRNSIVRRSLGAFLKWRSGGEVVVLRRLQELKEAEGEVEIAAGIASVSAPLAKALGVFSAHDLSPKFAVLMDSSERLIWVEVSALDDGSRGDLLNLDFTSIMRFDRAPFRLTFRNGVVAFAVPLPAISGAAVVCWLRDFALGASLSAIRFAQWSEWVGRVGGSLGKLVLLEVGRDRLRLSRQVNEVVKQAGTAPPELFDMAVVEHRLEAYLLPMFETVRRRLAISLSVLFVLLLGFGFKAILDFVRGEWDIIEPVAWLISMVMMLAVGVAGFLGFRYDVKGLRSRLWRRMRGWIVMHVLKALGGSG